jgi:hypothetical protein
MEVLGSGVMEQVILDKNYGEGKWLLTFLCYDPAYVMFSLHRWWCRTHVCTCMQQAFNRLGVL